MKELKQEISIRKYLYEELSDSDKQLIEAAKEATKRSYAPYSHFNVGAAVLLEDGTIITGVRPTLPVCVQNVPYCSMPARNTRTRQ